MNCPVCHSSSESEEQIIVCLCGAEFVNPEIDIPILSIPIEESHCQIDSDGTKRWRNQDGQYHRADGPAYEGAYGAKAWYLNDQRHRVDGPAIE